MGCTGSKDKLYKDEPNMVIWNKHFDKIGLSNEDVLQLRSKRNEIILSGQNPEENKLTIRILLDYIDSDLSTKPLLYKIFSAFRRVDTNGETNNLLEFSFSIWNMCTINDAIASEFIFSLYRGFSDRLGTRELVVLLKDAFGATYKEDEQKVKLLTEVLNAGQSKSLPEFQSFLQAHHEVIDIILETSKLVQEKVFGPEYWKIKATERASLSSETVANVFIAINPTVHWVGMTRDEKAKQVEILNKTKRKDAEEQTSRRNFHLHQPKIVPSSSLVPSSPLLKEPLKVASTH